ncbi:MAG: hypothetical protein M0Z28_24070 [Rhodospirillales bacterium]|nr:hypothetical protein [Rhodospirillales bacterium]
MTPSLPLDRRALLQAGAVALGTLATGLPRRGQAATLPAPEPLVGSLVAWVVLRPEDGADIRLAHLDLSGRLRGQAAPVLVPARALSAPAMLRDACRRAQAEAVSAAARSWGVPAAACRVVPGAIRHASGRSVGYAVWAEIA